MTKFTNATSADISTKGYPGCFIGLGDPSDWQQPRFIDWMKQSRGWGLGGGYGGVGVPRDMVVDGNVVALPDGYSKYSVILRTDLDPNGSTDDSMIAFWEGDGTVGFVANSVSNIVQGDHQVTFDIAYAVGRDIRLEVIPDFSNGTPVRNVRVMRQSNVSAYQSGEIFEPDWLSYIAPFAGYRFMDWLKTNHNGQSSWDTRTPVANETYAGKVTDTKPAKMGVPVSICTALCNKNQRAGWFCLPSEYDDDSIRAWAGEIADTLDPSLYAFIGYSNEWWNLDFSVTQWNGQRATAAGWVANGKKLDIGYGAKRACETMTIVREVFTEMGQLRRLRTVMNVHTAVLGYAQQAFEATAWKENEPDAWVDPATVHDYIAVTGYFGDMNSLGTTHGQEIINALAVSQAEAQTVLMGLVENSLDTLSYSLTRLSSAARIKGFKLIMYEASQHIDLGQLAFSENSPLWTCNYNVTDASGFQIGETIKFNGQYPATLLAVNGNTITMRTAHALAAGANAVGQTSNWSTTTTTNLSNQHPSDGVEDLFKWAYWSAEMAALQDQARDIAADLGIIWNQYTDCARYESTGNWGTKRWMGDDNPVAQALTAWAGANPRKVKI